MLVQTLFTRHHLHEDLYKIGKLIWNTRTRHPCISNLLIDNTIILMWCGTGPCLRLAKPGGPTGSSSVLIPLLPVDGNSNQLSKYYSFIILKFRWWTKSRRTLLHIIMYHCQKPSDFDHKAFVVVWYDCEKPLKPSTRVGGTLSQIQI